MRQRGKRLNPVHLRLPEQKRSTHQLRLLHTAIGSNTLATLKRINKSGV